jgi:hypothetical protein
LCERMCAPKTEKKRFFFSPFSDFVVARLQFRDTIQQQS